MMKKFFPFIFLLFLSINSIVLAFPNEPTSFRGLNWGSSIEDLKEKYPSCYEMKDDKVNALMKDTTGQIMIAYGTHLENDSISNIPIEKPIRYNFWNNQLEGVTIDISRDSFAASTYNENQIVTALETLYGDCTRKSFKGTSSYTNTYFWQGPICKISLIATYQNNDQNKSKVTILLTSKKISDKRLAQLEKIRQNKIKQGW